MTTGQFLQDKNPLLSQIYSTFCLKKREMFILFIGALAGIILCSLRDNALFLRNESIPIPMEQFPEPAWRTPQTLDVRVVTSTPFARFEIHKVKTENGKIINDWLWTDERSHINIIVHLKDENKFMLFRQKKYGLDKEYLALIGGLFNAGETSLDCAKRELLEETGLESDEWVNLGKYRVQVNRGGGILYAYMAKNAYKSKHSKPSDDYETQSVVKMSKNDLIRAALQGEIGEAQWVATAALGLLYEEYHEHHPTTTATN